MAFVGMVARPRRNVELALLVLAVAVATFADADLGLATTGTLPADLAFYAGGLAAVALVMHLMLRWRARYADPVILPIATAINGIGLVVIHRLDLAKRAGTASVAGRQWMWTAVGVVLAAAVVWLVA